MTYVAHLSDGHVHVLIPLSLSDWNRVIPKSDFVGIPTYCLIDNQLVEEPIQVWPQPSGNVRVCKLVPVDTVR